MKVRYSSRALRQLDDFFVFIETDNPAAARRVMTRIQRSIDRLTQFPYSCRETERPGIRVMSIVRFPYLVFYRVDEAAQEVQILRVRHSARNPKRHLG